MIDSHTLNPLLEHAFGGHTTWLEASGRFPLDEFIETFHATRERAQNTLEELTDAQATYASPAHSIWSISESVTHLIYSQGFYLNKLLDISTSQLPHVVEAARGFGEGAKPGISARELQLRLRAATEQIRTGIEGTRNEHDAALSEVNEFFGVCNYRTWMLLLLGHEVDHLRQIVAMRRVARADHVS